MAELENIPETGTSPPAHSQGSDPPSTTAAVSSAVDAGILPASHWEAIHDHIDVDDNDSTLGDMANSTSSLSSSIFRYRTFLGRTYHSEIGMAEGWTPNDERHAETMDMHHHMCTMLLDGNLFLAPIKDDVQKVIDIGTGTGIWAIDLGDMFPNAEVTGTDIAPIQPSWVPPNVRFEMDDANLEWTWNPNSIDFIHVRNMLGTIIDWPAFYREAFRCCKLGGWIEHHDEAAAFRSDIAEIQEDSAMGQWEKVFSQGGRKLGRTFRVLQDNLQKQGMEEAGFVDVVVKDYKCPMGDWPTDLRQKELGAFAHYTLTSDMEGFINYMWNAIMGWSPEEIQVYIAHLRRQMKDRTLQAWYPHREVYARKPE